MARGEIKIPMSADTSGIDKAIKNGIIEPAEDAEDALKKLAKVDAGRDIERDIEKAQDATDKLTDELDDARDELKKLSYAAKDVGDNTKDGMSRAEEGVEEFGDEAKSTAKEAAASFDGSAESIVDAFQEVAANAFAGFGPAGLLAGLAIAAGIGIAVQEFQKAADAAEELRVKAAEYAQEALEAGVSTDRWFNSAGKLLERIQELEEQKSTDARWFWEDDPSKLEDWTEAYEKLGREGSEVGDVLRLSFEGLTDYVDENKDALEDVRKELQDLYDTGKDDDATLVRIMQLEQEAKAYEDVIGYAEEQLDLQKESAESAERLKDAGIQSAQERAAAEEEAASRIESAQEAVEASALSAYDSMRNAAYDKATADDAAFNTDKWLASVEEMRAIADGYVANLESMKLTPAEWDNFLALPEDARASIAASYAAAGDEGKERIRAALSDGGSTAGADATVGFDENFNPDADVVVEADTSKAESDISSVTDAKYTAEIAVKTTGKADAKSDLDALAKTRHTTINVRADIDSANATVNSWRRSQESRPVYITVRARNGGSQLV